MKNIKYLLAALIIAASAVSCADADAAQTADTASAETGSTAAETEDVFDPFANLPEADYDGYEFNMLIRPTDRWVGDMYIEEATGDPVDDAVFERNSRISEQYNIKFTYTPSSSEVYETDATSVILAGDDAYDLIVTRGRAAFIYANQNLLLDWNTDLPYVNLEVRDGKWTYDVWEQMLRIGSSDLNGDGVIEMEYDRFGYVTQRWVGPVQAFATSGLRVLSKDENDIPYLTMMSDKTVEVFNRYCLNIIDSDVVFVSVGERSSSPDFIAVFDEGRSLFIDINMYNVSTMRSMTEDFGIIPWPKYDESSEYCTNVDAGTNMCAVPITAGDPERTSVILEAMSAIGNHSVLPAYYEVALQTKASRDDESAEMLDIIKSARIFDLGYYNSNMTGVYADEFVNFITNDLLRNFASWYEKNEKTVQKGLDKTLESYLE